MEENKGVVNDQEPKDVTLEVHDMTMTLDPTFSDQTQQPKDEEG